MKIFTLYLLKDIFHNYIKILGFIAFIIWIILTIQLIELGVISNLQSFKILYLSIISLLASFYHFASFCAAFAVPPSFFSTNSTELIACKAAGISNFALAKPIIIFAAILSITNFLFTSFLSPYFYNKVKIEKNFIRNYHGTLKLHENQFMSLGKFEIYFEKIQNGNLLENIIIYDISTPGKKAVIFAKSAKISKNQNGTYIELQEGSRQETNDLNETSMLTFSSYPLELRNFSPKVNLKKKSLSHQNLRELFKNYNSKEFENQHNEILREIINRISYNISSFNLPNIGFLGIINSKIRRTSKFGRFSIIYLILIFTYIAIEQIFINMKPYYISPLYHLLFSFSIFFAILFKYCRINNIKAS